MQLGKDIQVFVVSIDRGKVRLGFRCPPEVQILRGPELVDLDGVPRHPYQQKGATTGQGQDQTTGPGTS